MNRSAAVKTLPHPDRWDFEGAPYVAEPLTMPDPEEKGFESELSSSGASNVFEDACLRLLLMREMRDAPIEKGLGSAGPDDSLFWFRWITGHQVSFIIWRLLAISITKLEQGREPRLDALKAMTHYVRGYCGMLLYTSSCSREIYQKLIRPSMYLQHQAFSGSWAPDFRPVRDLFRGRMPPWAESSDAAELRCAMKLSQLIHNGVAAKLVPDGRSLLRQARFVSQDTAEERRLLGAIFDDYFMTLRAPVTFREVVAQLLCRLDVVTRDVAVNGLDVLGRQNEEKPVELRSADVIDLDAGFFNTCFRVAGSAAGFTDNYISEQLVRGCRASTVRVST